MLNVILCGGSGTRLWPLSREGQPKQFLNLFGQNSLFQETIKGNKHYCSEIAVICHTSQKSLALQQLKEIDEAPKWIILESSSRNTAPAVALSLQAVDPETILLFSPADHLINFSESYYSSLKQAEIYAEEGNVVVFGIVPKSPETGYGYIQVGDSDDVVRFVEKPNYDTAVKYLQSGSFFWNSGMICGKAKYLQQAIEMHIPQIAHTTQAAFLNSSKQFVPFSIYEIPQNTMDLIPSESFDYGVLEKMPDLKCVRSHFDWNDVGSFDSLYHAFPKDQHYNVSLSSDHISIDSTHNLIIGSNRLVTTVGIDGLAIIDTPDALLITPRHSSQKVKDIVHQLKQKTHPTLRSQLHLHATVASGQNYQVHTITLKHKEVEDHYSTPENRHQIVLLEGELSIHIEEKKHLLKRGESLSIEKNNHYSLESISAQAAVILQVITSTNTLDILHNSISLPLPLPDYLQTNRN